MADDTTPPPDDNTPISRAARDLPTPGEMLRVARVEKNLETKEIAASLNVDPWMLDALEHDEYAALGAPVFAKGHLRKYAAALGLDEGDLLVSYYQVEGTREAPPPLIAESILRVEARRNRGLGWIAPAAGVFALAVIAVGLFLYFQPEGGADAAQAATTEPEPSAVSTGARSQSLRLPTAPAGDTASSPAAVAPPSASTTAPTVSSTTERNAASDTTASTPPPPTRSETAAPVRAPNTAPITAKTEPEPRPSPNVSGRDTANESSGLSSGSSSVAAPVRVASAAPAVASAAAASRPATAPTGTGEAVRVTLDFDGDSWVEVYDANRRKLLYDMGEAGTRRTVSGDGPLQVFLGKAVDVNIRIDGEPFSVPRISRLGTARFYATSDGIRTGAANRSGGAP